MAEIHLTITKFYSCCCYENDEQDIKHQPAKRFWENNEIIWVHTSDSMTNTIGQKDTKNQTCVGHIIKASKCPPKFVLHILAILFVISLINKLYLS